MTTVLICMTDPGADIMMSERLTEAGFSWTICIGVNTDDILDQFDKDKADVLIYDPGTPYQENNEKLVRLINTKMAKKAVLYCSVSVSLWDEFLKKNNIDSPIFNQYEGGPDSMRRAIASALEVTTQ